jgi:hypothetical protein
MEKLRKIGFAKNIDKLIGILNGYGNELSIGRNGKGMDVYIGGGEDKPYYLTLKNKRDNAN